MRAHVVWHGCGDAEHGWPSPRRTGRPGGTWDGLARVGDEWQALPGLLAPTRFPTAGSRTGAGAPGRVRLNKLVKFGAEFAVVFGLAALAAHLVGRTTMVAGVAVNIAVAIGVAVGGRVGDSRSYLWP